jgi:hypothetical protein
MSLSQIMLATAPYVVVLLGGACIGLAMLSRRSSWSERLLKKIEDLIRG